MHAQRLLRLGQVEVQLQVAEVVAQGREGAPGLNIVHIEVGAGRPGDGCVLCTC